jgi:hypothetical protein
MMAPVWSAKQNDDGGEGMARIGEPVRNEDGHGALEAPDIKGHLCIVRPRLRRGAGDRTERERNWDQGRSDLLHD